MRRIAIMGTAGAVAATAATFALTTLTTSTAQAGELTPFKSCDELRDWYVDAALPQVTAWGWNGFGWGYYMERGIPAAAQADAAMGVAGAAEGAVGNSSTGTNVQEAGVDEPDIAKTNGKLTIQLVDGRTMVVTDVSGSDPVELSRYKFPKDMYANEMLLVGDTVIVDGTSYNPTPEPRPGFDFAPRPYPTAEPQARVLTISIANGASPTLVADRRIDGHVLTMRQYGDVVRVVTATGYPMLDFVYPDNKTSQKEALQHNREVVKSSTIGDWLPTISTGKKDAGSPLVACSDVSHPQEQSGFGTISILTFPAAEVDAARTIAVTAGGDLVYSSADRLYLATTSWGWNGGPIPLMGVGIAEDDVAPAPAASGEGDAPVAPPKASPADKLTPGAVIGSTEPGSSGGGSDSSSGSAGSSDGSTGADGDSAAPAPDAPTAKPPETTSGDSDGTVTSPDQPVAATKVRQSDITTEIHAFALDGLDTTYVASGEVKGTVKDRWSFSEFDHDLRVATGLGQSWMPTDNAITVLREDGDKLVTVGRVRGLGPDEQIQSVRWLGTLAVLVTFRQTDPLYTVDLSDPAHPKVLGELKIRGFSAYLHPIGDGLLLGIGQDARLNGQTIGGQAAVFDIGDATDPQRLDTFSFGAHSYPAASWEPRAFTYLPDKSLAITPVTNYRGRTTMFVLAIGSDGSITRQQVVNLPNGWAEVTRTLPIDGGRVAIITHGTVTLLNP